MIENEVTKNSQNEENKMMTVSELDIKSKEMKDAWMAGNEGRVLDEVTEPKEKLEVAVLAIEVFSKLEAYHSPKNALDFHVELINRLQS